MGADADTASVEETKLFAKELKEAAKMLGFKVRIGFKKYIQDGDTFVHVDVCPEYYAKGKPYHHKPHPAAWEVEMEW